jgi:hypothetical protein
VSTYDPNDPAWDDQGDQGGQAMRQISAKDLRKLKEQRREGEKAIAERDALARELSFVKAGVDPAHPAAAIFARGYDGDPTPEAVKEAWAAMTGVTGDAGGPPPSADELAALGRADELTSGAAGQLPPDKLAERDAKLRAAKTEREFDEIYAEYGGATGTLVS